MESLVKTWFQLQVQQHKERADYFKNALIRAGGSTSNAARLCGMSHQTYSKAFKAHVGKTPTAWMKELRNRD